MVPTFVSTLSCTLFPVFLDLIVFDIFSFSLFSAILFAFYLKSLSRLMNTRTQEVIYLHFCTFDSMFFCVFFGLVTPFNITKLCMSTKTVTKIVPKLTRLLKSTHYFWYLEMKGVCAIFVTASCHKSVCACVRVFTV